MKNFFRFSALAIALIALPMTAAKAAFIDINIAGWNTFGGYALPGGINSGSSVNIGAGSTITSVEYFDVTFESLGASWGSELVLSVNDDDGLGAWLDWSPSETDDPGAFGPFSGVFGTPPGVPGPFGLGSLSVSTSGSLWVTAYESFNDGGNSVQDAAITAGTIRINYTPVPEPSAALLGLLSVGLDAMRRRRA